MMPVRKQDVVTHGPTRGAEIDRRSFLAAGSAGLAWAGLGGAIRNVHAATSPYSFRHGVFEITVLSDGYFFLPPPGTARDVGFLYPDVPRAALETFMKGIGQGMDRVQLPNNVVLVRSSSDLMLIDTGAGAGWQPTAGKLVENLQSAGIDPARITKVIFTHAHPDHLWGVANGDGALHFPNASYVVSAAEWNFWMADDVLNKVPENFRPFALGARRDLSRIRDKLETRNPDDEIVSGLRLMATFGHTPGHVSVEIAGADPLVIAGDVVANAAVSFAHPEWRFGIDALPDVAIRSRQRLLDRAASEKMRLLGSHWPYPGLGTVERVGSAYRFVASN
jgi:glyoxylase-like metal-dependent hydrolase (beta-lactamase superfamily II)